MSDDLRNILNFPLCARDFSSTVNFCPKSKTITICAVICGAETWEDIELFGDCKHKFFKGFLELPNGIPCHDTFARLFARLDPKGVTVPKEIICTLRLKPR